MVLPLKDFVDDLKKDKIVCLCHIALGGLNKLWEIFEPKKVDGINVSKDFIDHNMKNLSIVTSTGIMNGVVVVYWVLAELFEKLKRWDEATCICKKISGVGHWRWRYTRTNERYGVFKTIIGKGWAW